MSHASDENAEQPPPPPRRQGPRPIATYSLIGTIVVIYLIGILLSNGLFQPDFLVLVVMGAKVNQLIDLGQYWRLLTATFLHASLVHIFFNSFALYALGPEAERIYGLRRFLTLYFLAGLGGSVASYLFSPNPSVGASGAVFGLIGGLGIFFYFSRAVLGEFGRTQVQSMGAIAAINLLIGLSLPGTIDNWGHIGGLIAGLIVGAALAPRLQIDNQFFPPVLVRSYPPWGWSAAAALGIGLVGLAVVLPGAS
ncbi:MAG: rhomboid family intramembrane serine protease [Oscillochloridaceae bacterium umkhey_bin13]